MDWITKLERKFGRYAIPNIMQYMVVLQVVGFALRFLAPGFYEQYLQLNAEAIMHGQVWRIFTFLLDPPSASLIFIIFALYLYYMIGQSLEAVWGAFRFNLYLLSGIVFHVLAVLIIYLVMGTSFVLDAQYLYLSLFLAFAALFPDTEFLLFFILPIKAKWLAIVDILAFGWTILQGILPAYANSPFGLSYKANAIAASVSLLNFLLYYFSSRKFRAHSPGQIHRKQKFKRQVHQAQKQQTVYSDGARHKCAVCGRTELTNPELEFRYCSKCNGNYEYCQDHLFTHEHIH